MRCRLPGCPALLGSSGHRGVLEVADQLVVTAKRHEENHLAASMKAYGLSVLHRTDVHGGDT
jgi:hypothetical protein